MQAHVLGSAWSWAYQDQVLHRRRIAWQGLEAGDIWTRLGLVGSGCKNECGIKGSRSVAGIGHGCERSERTEVRGLRTRSVCTLGFLDGSLVRRVVVGGYLALVDDGERKSGRVYAENGSVMDEEENEVGDKDIKVSKLQLEPGWAFLQPWDVPWDGKVTSLAMFSWIISFLMTGLVVSVTAAQLGIGRRQFMDLDSQSFYILIHQLAQTVAGLSVLNVAIKPYKPLEGGLLSYAWKSPFSLQNGWVTWGGFGIICAGAAVLLSGTVVNAVNGGQPLPRDEGDALLQLMPIIGFSPISTASLICVTGVLAPLLEETVFRGFLLTSLTKWMPTPVAVLLSACAFAGAHLSPGEFPQLLALGIVLGFSYAQTRTLLTPILIHSVWNSGVLVLLTFLHLQGYDLKQII